MKRLIKKNIIIIIILLLLTLSLTGTIAYLISKSNTINSFIIGTIKPTILETFDEEKAIKENVKIKNDGNSNIYVRVAVLYSFVDENGIILDEVPKKDTDYTIEFSSSSNWILLSDGYYYYKNVLKENEQTDNLIDICKPINKYDDKKLVVEIVSQGIQAKPTKAVTDSWNVNIIDEKIEGEL